MTKYLIRKDNATNQIVFIDLAIHSYKFIPKKREDKLKFYIEVNEVTVYNPSMIDVILTAKFNKTFKKMITLCKMVIEDEDATEDSAIICLDEVELVRQILVNKYETFLSKEKEQLFLKKLRIIENELRIKQMLIKEKAMYLEQMEELENHRSR